MKNTIQIDGKEFDYLGKTKDGRGIYTNCGTFWMNPVCLIDENELPRLIQKKDALPRQRPQSICKIEIKETGGCWNETEAHSGTAQGVWLPVALQLSEARDVAWNKLKHKVVYTSGQVIYLNSLSGPDPLPDRLSKKRLSKVRSDASLKRKKRINDSQWPQIIEHYRRLRKAGKTKSSAGDDTVRWIQRATVNGGLGLSSVTYSSRQIQRRAGEAQ
jgi:hypothetical protein